MALKWMWGFEIGADETFYSGSGWQDSLMRFQSTSSGGGTYLDTHIESKNMVDYKNNFPHQPLSSVGGGYYSLKIDAGEIVDYNTSLMASDDPFGVMTLKLGAISTASLSFSVYSDFDQTEWPGAADPNDTLYLQRFMALYPNEATLAPVILAGAGRVPMSGASNNQMSTLMPQLQLFMFRTGSVNKILAACITGSGTPGSVPDNPLLDYLLTSTAAGSSWIDNVTGAVNAGGNLDSYYVYTSSAGQYLSGNAWTEVSVQYHPHNVNGSLKIYLNGDEAINVSGVSTGYTGSYDGDTDTPILDNINNIGRVLFTATPFFANPSAWISSVSSALEPSNFWYDHVCLFDEASDLSTATASIFIQGLKPVSDNSIGNFVGDGLETVSLYNYVNDPNAAMETSYIQAGGVTDASFNLQDIDVIDSGAKLFVTASVGSYIGVGVINACENVGATSLNANSLMSGTSQALGETIIVSSSAKQMFSFVSGSDPDGADWSLSSINSLKSGIKIS